MTAEIVALPEPSADLAPVDPPRRAASRNHLHLVPRPTAPSDGDRLLHALASGDERAWRDTVARYERLARSSAAAVVRTPSDVDEAVARTWERLLRHALQIKDSQRLCGWLATTARREALALVRDRQRQVPVAEVADAADPAPGGVDAALLQGELSRALRSAVETLPPHQRTLVRALLDGTESYAALAVELGIPHGSIGPTRMRAVAQLRRRLLPQFA